MQTIPLIDVKAQFEPLIPELEARFREVLLLCDVEEMSYQEISETVSIPMGTVMSRLSRARRTLRKALQEKEVRHE